MLCYVMLIANVNVSSRFAKNRDAQKKRSSHKAVESVLRTEGSLWWERFEEKLGLEP